MPLTRPSGIACAEQLTQLSFAILLHPFTSSFIVPTEMPCAQPPSTSADQTRAHDIAASSVPTKVCIVCGESFCWRKKWERCWDDMRTCSKDCNLRGRAAAERVMYHAPSGNGPRSPFLLLALQNATRHHLIKLCSDQDQRRRRTARVQSKACGLSTRAASCATHCNDVDNSCCA